MSTNKLLVVVGVVEAVVQLNVIVYDSVSIEDGDDDCMNPEVSELLRTRA